MAISGVANLDGGPQSGVTVIALDETGTKLDDTTTASDGTYSFDPSLPCFVGPIYDDGSQVYSHDDGFIYVSAATDTPPDAPTNLVLTETDDAPAAPTNLSLTEV